MVHSAVCRVSVTYSKPWGIVTYPPTAASPFAPSVSSTSDQRAPPSTVTVLTASLTVTLFNVPQVDNNATCSRRSRKMRVATSTNSKIKAEVDGELYCRGYIFLRSYQYNAAL